jgi:outer membrane protein TolC
MAPQQNAAQRLPAVNGTDMAAAPAHLMTRRVRHYTMMTPGEVDDPLAHQGELSVDNLIREILARNQSLAAMQAAWRAAAQRYPQAVALDDPMLMTLMAPGSFSDPNHQSSWMAGASQQLPWPGKRQLRGAVARAEMSAAYFDAGDLAVRLAATGRNAYYAYFLSYRELELLNENARRLQEFRDLARTQYESKSVTQQDFLQAEVELAELDRQRIEIERDSMVAAARINTLLHRLPNYPLPPPAREITAPQRLPEPELLYQAAIQRRPDLAALAAKVRAEQATTDLARREYLPDFNVGGRYDQFWDRVNQRGQLSVNLNVPLYQQKRDAAVREAMFRAMQRRSEYEQLVDTIRNDVQAAYQNVLSSQKTVYLYQRRILPAIDQNVTAARTAYESRQGSFLSLVEAQRQLIDGQMKEVQALAEYHRQVAELEQALAGPIPYEPAAEEVPAVRGRLP